MRSWRADYLRDGFVIARNFLDEATLMTMQDDMQHIVEKYAKRLSSAGRLAGAANQRLDRTRGLSFDHRYTALYEANLRSNANRGKRSDLPAFFRGEGHSAGIYKFLTHARLHELVRCLLPHEAEVPPALKLYPVYMLRGKVPDAISKSAMTVDWHQDAEYTYYWYTALNASQSEIDVYANSVVNTWVPVTDVTHELGPVQLVRKRPLSLTRAELRCEGVGCGDDGIATANDSAIAREYLRVAEMDAYINAYPERLVTAEMRRGDVLLFDQFTYHRGLPNISPNITRWSVDFRFQDARAPTMRSEPGFVLGSDDLAADAADACGAPLIASDEDWVAARPSLRLSEMRAAERNLAIGGNGWAVRHIHAGSLMGALEMERSRFARKRRD